jgi:hypothetical protein
MQQLGIVKSSAAFRVGPMQAMQDAMRPWLSGRRGLVIAGIAIVAAGLALGWNWLSAIGVAPIILSLAPCAAMCAPGACGMMRGNSSCAKPDPLEQPPIETEPDRQAP